MGSRADLLDRTGAAATSTGEAESRLTAPETPPWSVILPRLRFPITPDAYQKTRPNCGSQGGDAFLMRLNATGSKLLYSSYVGANNIGPNIDARGIAWDLQRNSYIAGNAF